MSSERASSAVRNLRSIFENKASDSSPDTRGRSRSGLTDKEGSRPTSKVRASFVSVEKPGSMATPADSSATPFAELKRESSASLRRGSFSEKDADGELSDLKKTVSQEAERREKDSKVAEAIPEHAAESTAVTPRIGAETDDHHAAVDESPLANKEESEPANLDKPVTGTEEETGQMKPADLADASVVSGGEAMPPVAEDLRSDEPAAESKEVETENAGTKTTPTKKALDKVSSPAKSATLKAASNSKPSPISTKAPSKPVSSAMKSPANQSRVSSSSTAAKPEASKSPRQLQPAKKASRSSLTAPTASSVARAAASDKQESRSTSQSIKPKPREGTKPIDLPSRLTAPTAASKARHDPSPAIAPSSSAPKPSTTSRPKPQSTPARPTPRSSLGPGQRPESRTSHAPAKKSAPVDGSFLDRMMRPTAASASKTHEKTEPKSPPRTSKTAAPTKPRANGYAKKPATAKPSSRPSTAKASEEPAFGGEGHHESSEHANAPALTSAEPTEQQGEEVAPSEPDETPALESKKEEPSGIETPTPHTNGVEAEEADAALETTPAFGGQEETIR